MPFASQPFHKNNPSSSEGTASDRTHLFIFITFIKKNKEKNWNCRRVKISKAINRRK